MCKYYEISKEQVSEYIQLINKEELKYILEIYGTDKKQIKRLCK